MWKLYKMGKSRSYSNDHSEKREKIPKGKYYMSIRCSPANHHWQWAPLERWQNLSILFQLTHCHEPIFSMPPTNQRPSRVVQQKHFGIHKETIEWRERFMGRRITKYAMGNPNNSALETRDTPFNLVFESNVVIPIEIVINSLRVSHFDVEQNDATLRANLDIFEEIIEEASVKTSK